MKYKLLILMTAILLVGTIVYAGDSIKDSISVTLDKVSKDKLAEYKIITPEVSELFCDGEVCKFKMYDGDYNLGEHSIEQRYCSDYEQVCNNYEQVCIDSEQVNGNCLIYENGKCLEYNNGTCLETSEYSDAELGTMKQKAIENWLENYAGILKVREEKIKEIKSNKGVVSIK